MRQTGSLVSDTGGVTDLDAKAVVVGTADTQLLGRGWVRHPERDERHAVGSEMLVDRLKCSSRGLVIGQERERRTREVDRRVAPVQGQVLDSLVVQADLHATAQRVRATPLQHVR